MSSIVDIKLALGRGNAIKGVHNVGLQPFELNRLATTRNRKEKEKRDEAGARKFARDDEGRVRNHGTKAGAGSEEQHSDSGAESKKRKDSEVRGGLVDVII